MTTSTTKTTTPSRTWWTSTCPISGGSWGSRSSRPGEIRGTSSVFKSIRTTLLFWYGLIFLILVGSFATTVYVRLRRSVFKAVDAKLEDFAHSIAGGLVEKGGGRMDLELPESVRMLFRRGDDQAYYVIWDRTGRILHRSTE